MNGDIKIGKLLCDGDIITKRQLNKALQAQIKGDKRTLGEILVDMNYCSLDDITEILLNQEEMKEQYQPTEPKPVQTKVIEKPIIEPEPVKEEPVELSEEKVLGTKFSMSIQTIIALVSLISAGVGGYYMLLQEIEEAKNLPEINIEEIFTDEYPSKPDGHNWPRSYEQYKNQVGGLQEDMDAVYETLDEYEEQISELEKLVGNLRVEVARKKEK